MSKGNKDKFLPVFFGTLGLGVLAFGYLSWSASSAADEAEAKFTAKKQELKELEEAPLTRSEDNAKRKKEQVDAYIKKVQDLSKVMQAYQAPLNTAENNVSFQAKLAKASTAVKEAAAARKVTLNEKFDLGMGRYLSNFPVQDAAPRLSAELDAIVALSNAAINAGVLEINSLTRQELDFELEKKEDSKPDAKDPKAKKTTPAASTAKTAADKKATAKPAGPVLDESKVLERQPISMTVTGKNKSILAFLQSIANATPENPHFFVIRTLKIENESKDGPPKGIQPEVKEEPNPKNKDAPIKRDAIYLLGFENVKAQLELDLVRFVPEAPPEEKGKPASKPVEKTAAVNK